MSPSPLSSQSPHCRSLAAPLCAWALAVALSTGARADEVSEVMRLHSAGQTAAALERAERHLAQSPRDASMRFQRALLLADSGRTAQSIEAFTALTQDHPDLPEPYNNLAALQASLGDFDRARSSLEMALRSQPGYAAAHENLGDVYVALARRAYARTLQLEPANASAAPKLALLRQLAVPVSALPSPVSMPTR